MRAHFAGVPPSDSADSIDPGLDVAEANSLKARIDDFKRDPNNMEALNEFLDDVLQKAETEASKQQNAKNTKNLQQSKEKRQSFALPDFKNGKVVNRARGLVVRIFDAICNCANTAAGPAQRIKLRSKRAAAQAAAAAVAAATGDPQAPEGEAAVDDKDAKDVKDAKEPKERKEKKDGKKKMDKDKLKEEKSEQQQNAEPQKV